MQESKLKMSRLIKRNDDQHLFDLEFWQKLSATERFNATWELIVNYELSKGKKIFYIISLVLGFIALIGFILIAVGLSYSFGTVSFIGYLLILPFLILLAGVLISYARI